MDSKAIAMILAESGTDVLENGVQEYTLNSIGCVKRWEINNCELIIELCPNGTLAVTLVNSEIYSNGHSHDSLVQFLKNCGYSG
jgi:hypothetical protein